MLLTIARAADFLRRLNAGEEAAVDGDQASWDSVFAGDHEWTMESGWKLVVFNDCDEWDYVDSIIDPSGEIAKFDDWHEDVIDVDGRFIRYKGGDDAQFIRNYEPNDVAKKALRLKP